MCLGIPGQIVGITDPERKLAMVDISGVRREVNVTCVAINNALEDLVGQWTLIHVGFAMSLIDEAEAALTLKALHELDEVSDTLESIEETKTMLGAETQSVQEPWS